MTIYHLILEGTLGLTSFRFITDFLSERDLLPGFVDGYSRIHHDETRHIGYGVWWLRETVRERPEQRRRGPRDAARAAARGGRVAQAAGRGDAASSWASTRTSCGRSRWAG